MRFHDMRRYDSLVITQLVVLLAVADRLLGGNAPLRRVSGTIRAGLIAKSGCRQSITVLRTDYLPESVSQILEKAIDTQCPKECALLCFQAKCNVFFMLSEQNF
ncbi:unnamed protein product [Litomosoides sigmodontis]|uniref:Uncharacterized protein n=1 Tax=Litomosoides sigmodontis TaxID=42156 RepID=A0A3P6SFT3_LITSI|nr:unnamed protein product [Litomosoides sigmodontis]